MADSVAEVAVAGAADTLKNVIVAVAATEVVVDSLETVEVAAAEVTETGVLAVAVADTETGVAAEVVARAAEVKVAVAGRIL